MQYSECLYHPLPFYATQIINPFLTSKISAKLQYKVGILAYQEILILPNVPLVSNLFLVHCTYIYYLIWDWKVFTQKIEQEVKAYPPSISIPLLFGGVFGISIQNQGFVTFYPNGSGSIKVVQKNESQCFHR